MKNCPNCNSEIEDNFEICWNCNYSLTENKIVEFEDPLEKKKDIDCLRCKVPLIFSGNFKFHEGTQFGVFGNLFEAFVNRESFDLYICPKCGKVEFFSPQIDT
jgi:Zn finger protein HypA/HybF involved in hydrogenase expression